MRPISPEQNRQEPRTGDPGVTAAQPLANTPAQGAGQQRERPSLPLPVPTREAVDVPGTRIPRGC